jgi:S1-C subfamily serine protease
MEIYLHDGASSFRIVVLGALVGPAAAELDRTWKTASSVLDEGKFVIDITGLTAIDGSGLSVLSRMHDSGCLLKAQRPLDLPGIASLVQWSAPNKSTTGNLEQWKRTLLQYWPLLLSVMLLAVIVRTTACSRPAFRYGADGQSLPGKPTEQVVETAVNSVCLIQGTYVFRDRENGMILRRRNWFLDGDDSVLENTYSGTGFLISSQGKILTNRHIAQPWWADPGAQKIVSAGYQPELTSLKAYFPGRQATHVLKTVRISEKADIALLQADPPWNLPPPLELSDGGGATPGGTVLVIGFPGGLGPIFGRGGQAQIQSEPGSLNFSAQQVTQALARRDLIEPFVSFGHVSNTRNNVLTLAVQTSEGSSGSPVLNEQGAIIGILYASLTSVNGGSLAVPVQAARDLIIPREGT